MAYLPEPPHRHGTAEKTGVMLVNLGTPEAPTKEALKPYLKEFLSDPRVVEMPRLLWLAILNGVILNTRPAKSAEKYATIWMPEGSPLKVYTRRQADLLQGYLGERLKGGPLAVEYAMRYGKPGIPEVMAKLKAENCQKILVVPLYPQYAASAAGSVFDAVADALKLMRNVPGIRMVKHFHDHPGYIKAVASGIRDHWAKHGRPNKLVMSFHGVPQATHDAGDPYYCECRKSGRLIAGELGLSNDEYLITFQSRFGRAQWLKPYTAATLTELGRQKLGRVDVVCPGFVADCLETLEEIAGEVREDFKRAGGGEYHYIPCLNDRHEWINALSDLVVDNLQGWLDVPDAAELEQGRLRALAQGAKQ
jgi:ferrochelatase